MLDVDVDFVRCRCTIPVGACRCTIPVGAYRCTYGLSFMLGKGWYV